MKKHLLSLLLGMVILSLCFSAAADVIWEPEDDFYRKHAEECRYEDRNYLANGSEGYIPIYGKPTDKQPRAYLFNGTSVYISYCWEDWGLANYQDTQGQVHFGGGWIPLDALVADYDHTAFLADHGSELRELEAPVSLDLSGYDAVYLWELPGSASRPWNMKELDWAADDNLSFHSLWTDGSGNDWGYVGYFYQHSGWICLSAPEAPTLPVTEPELQLIPAAAALPEVQTLDVTAIALLLAALAVVTVAVILICYRKRIR